MTARAWLRWQARISGPAAGAAGTWARRLRAHPRIAAALANGTLTVSYARHICDQSDALPEDNRADDQILLNAHLGGADTRDLAALAEEIAPPHRPPRRRRREAVRGPVAAAHPALARPRPPRRRTHPQAAAALRAVLDTLGRKTGPEDDRTSGQRDHDALEEACI
jgi:hypothetical protein